MKSRHCPIQALPSAVGVRSLHQPITANSLPSNSLRSNLRFYAAPRNRTQVFSFHAPARSLLHNGGVTSFRVKIYRPIFPFHFSNFRISPLSPFPATLTRKRHFCRKTAPVSRLLATLTDTPSRKSFPCRSYENIGGVPPLVPASKSRRPRNPLTPLESALTKNMRGRGYRQPEFSTIT